MKHLVRNVLTMTLVLLLGAMAIPFAIAGAQEASPEAAGPSLLEGLGLPVLEVTISAEGIDAPAEVPAGLLLLVAHNTTDALASADLAQLPEGVTVEEYIAVGEGIIPEWAADLVVAGYVEVAPMSSASIVLNLAPGDWQIISIAEAELAETSVPLTATGDGSSAASIAADIEVAYGEYAFDIPDDLAVGPQIVHVTNAHTVPHHAVFFPTDRLYSPDEVLAGVMAEFMATPVAEGGFSFATSIVGEPFELPVLTAGQEVWLEVDVTPGFWAAVCFVADPGSDVPHLAQGMIDTFEISGE